MAFLEYFLRNDIYQNGKRLNKGTKLEFTTPGNGKPMRNDIRKAALEKFPDSAKTLGCHDILSLFTEKK